MAVKYRTNSIIINSLSFITMEASTKKNDKYFTSRERILLYNHRISSIDCHYSTFLWIIRAALKITIDIKEFNLLLNKKRCGKETGKIEKFGIIEIANIKV